MLQLSNPFNYLIYLATFAHPYETEINELKFMNWQMQKMDVTKYNPLEETVCNWICTKDDLVEMIKVLSPSKQLAIDLEAHSYRSYQGFTCLMQISNRKVDFLVDTIGK